MINIINRISERRDGKNMRIYISADIEGVTDVTSWDETEKGEKDYEEACRQMTREVAAACRGAMAAGATEIVVKDAHDSARNLDHSGLPKGVKLIRGWAGEPESMVALVDRGFDGAFFVGYHSEAGSNRNPLAHTSTYTGIFDIKLNGEHLSEMQMYALACAQYGVPVIMVTGDSGICSLSEKLLPTVRTVAVKEGIGGATLSIHPEDACERIENAAKEAVGDLKEGKAKCIQIPEKLTLDITLREHKKAANSAHYPGASLIDGHTVRFETDNYHDLLEAFSFIG